MIGNLPTRKAVDEELSTMGKVSTKGKWLLGATKVITCGHSRYLIIILSPLDHHIWVRHPCFAVRIRQEGQEQEEGSEEREQQEAGGQAEEGQDVPEEAGGGPGPGARGPHQLRRVLLRLRDDQVPQLQTEVLDPGRLLSIDPFPLSIYICTVNITN